MGELADFPDGSMRKLEISGKQVLLVNMDGQFFAVGNICTHRGGPLNEIPLDGKVATCSWHGGQFDVTTGKVISPPPKLDEPAFEVKIQGNDVMIRTQ